MQNVHIPIVRVDPENRCAVMLVYGTKLVVLPFRKDTLTDEQESGVGEGYARSFLSSTNASTWFPSVGLKPNPLLILLTTSLNMRVCHQQTQVQLSTQLHHRRP